MDLDDLTPRPAPEAPLGALAREDLDRLSVTELDARIEALDAELARTRARRAAADALKSAAAELFRRA